MSIAHILTKFLSKVFAMNQNLLGLQPPNPELSCASKYPNNLVRCCAIGWRFLRHKCYPWLMLAFTPVKLLLESGEQRTRTQIRYFTALIKIDFVSVYELLNDLLW